MSKKPGKKQRRRKRFQLYVAIILAALMALALGVGLYFGLPGEKSASELFKDGQEAFSEGDYEKAIDLYKKGIEKQPDVSSGYNLLGMAYRYQFNQTGSESTKQEEIEAFKKAVQLDPNDPVPYLNLGVTFFYQGSKAEAAIYLGKALELDPNHPDRTSIEDMIRQCQEPR